ncbi:MAG: DNA-protecting protein DprA [bacterium]|nr:DNA-protecting protein DprA [bacterium]MCP4799815.1 DNA-protecting protein DprA [bacterium]
MHKLLRKGDKLWPSLWNEINDSPSEVNVAGNAKILHEQAIAIVGTRRASNLGKAIARRIAMDLSNAGYVIVSGLAMGIDTAAHRGALDGSGKTVAVMATSIEETYPPGNSALRKEIESQGCVVSESQNTPVPFKYLFPRRNRLVAGLVAGVIVIESPGKSGSLITAKLAIDYNREVFAVPGPIDNANWRGSHQLIKDGAHLIECAEDVLEVLGSRSEISSGPLLQLPQEGTSSKWLWDRIDLSGAPLADLQMQWPGDPADLAEGLLALEMANMAVRLPGAKVARTVWTSSDRK